MASSLERNEVRDGAVVRVDRQTERTGGEMPAPVPEIEEQALALLHSADVTASGLAQLARSPQALKSRKVLVCLAGHPRTPRHISIPLLRRMFTFDLMQVTLTPVVAGDIKRVAEDQILLRLESLSIGEKVSLGRRSSGRIATELLRDTDSRVVSAALDNSRLVEAGVVNALMKSGAAELIFNLVSAHSKWGQRREVQIALLRSEKTPMERAREFAKHFSSEFLQEIVPEERRAELVPPE